MAEESIKLSLTPEITEPHGGHSGRNFTGKRSSPNNGQNRIPHFCQASVSSFHDGNNSRRNSTGKPSSRNIIENVLPHNLRASTGSCHDFCKDGRKHAFEVKARHPVPKIMTISPSEKKINIGIVVPAEKKKTAVVKLRPSPDSKAHLPNPSEIFKRKVLLPSKKVEVSSKQDLSKNKKMTENEMKMTSSVKCSPSVKAKPVLVKPSSSSDVSVGLNGQRNSDIKLGKKTGTSKAAVKKVPALPIASLSPQPPVSRAVSFIARKYSSLELVSLKDQNRIRKTKPKQPDDDVVWEKTLHVVKAETENKILESIRSGGIIQSLLSPLLPSPKSSSHPNSPSLSSHEDDLKESEYTDSVADDSENDEIKDFNEVETSKGNHNRTPRNGGLVLSEDKDCALVKLKFRRGKVVDLQSENNGPRRLRFRRRSVLEDKDSDGDARTRIFKREDDNDTNGSSPCSEKVALRHQDVQGKKDAQGLFNNVIEETASKLVESRKSKVKALVGAFETLISLQDSKPSTQTVTSSNQNFLPSQGESADK